MILEHTNPFHDDSYILTSTEKPPAGGGFFCEVCVYVKSTYFIYLLYSRFVYASRKYFATLYFFPSTSLMKLSDML